MPIINPNKIGNTMASSATSWAAPSATGCSNFFIMLSGNLQRQASGDEQDSRYRDCHTERYFQRLRVIERYAGMSRMTGRQRKQQAADVAEHLGETPFINYQG